MSKQKTSSVVDMFDEVLGRFEEHGKEEQTTTKQEDENQVPVEQEEIKKQPQVKEQLKKVVKRKSKTKEQQSVSDGVQVMFYCYAEFKKNFLYYKLENDYATGEQILNEALEKFLKKKKVEIKFDIVSSNMDENKTINWTMTKEMHKKVKMACIDNDISLKDYVGQALAEYIGWTKLIQY
jgi:hypothetical protein